MRDRFSDDPVKLATDLTIAWLANINTRVSADEAPAFLRSMYDSVSSLGSVATAKPSVAPPEHRPAVSSRKSLSSPEHIISMIDGKPYKSLRRHLSGHGLTPEQYRQRFNLEPDYPMVAPSYSIARREIAKKIGLGRKLGQTATTAR